MQGETWMQTAKLVALGGAAGDLFGWSVAVSPGLIAVGALGSEAVYVYTPDTFVNWTRAQKLLPSDAGTDAFFGESVGAPKYNNCLK